MPAAAETDRRAASWRVGLLALAPLVVVVPLVLAGPGTDLDAGAVIRSGSEIVHHLHYVPSRPPGAPVYEAAVGLLELVGGHVLANLGSLAMGVAAALLVFKLARDNGVQRPWLSVAILTTNPWFLVAATSVQDFIWGLALFLAGVVALRARRPWLAGLAFALATGCRVTTIVLVIVAVIAELVGGSADRRRQVLTCAATSIAVAAALFVPSFVAAGETLRFLDNNFTTSSPAVQLGRFAAKDLYIMGPLAFLILLWCAPAVIRLLKRWRELWLVRFATLGLLASQLLFLRFPWKMGHLLPTVVFLALLVPLAWQGERWRVQALVGAQALYCLVGVTLLVPNHPNQATGGRPTARLTWGALVRDTQCRLRYRHDVESPIPTVSDRAGSCATPFAGRP